jgi:Sec-independent protein translocase protein TatA
MSSLNFSLMVVNLLVALVLGHNRLPLVHKNKMEEDNNYK